MKIFYGKSTGRADVPGKSPVDAPLNTTLEVFHTLEPLRGFIGIQLDEKFTFQILNKNDGRVSVELLNTSIPAWDAANVDPALAESLIHAAFAGQNVFEIARAKIDEWTHFDSNDLNRQATQQEEPWTVMLRLQQARLAAMQGPPKPQQSVTYPLASIASGDQCGLWVSIHFNSATREFDVLHIVGGDAKRPIYLERYDQILSCYQGAERIEITRSSVTVTLNAIGQMALGLPSALHFVSPNHNKDLEAATEMFSRMKQFESGGIITLSQPPSPEN